MKVHLEPAGPYGLYVSAQTPPSETLTAQLRELATAIHHTLGPQIIDITQGWDSLLIQYDMLKIDYVTLYRQVEALIEASCVVTPDTHEIRDTLVLPVLYDGEDLTYVAQQCGVSVQEVMTLHSGSRFHVGAIGFAPGFAYLGGLDTRLDMPRRSIPRAHVPAGSVSIAAGQSALYPQNSPGGWHLIGRCPWCLFDPYRQPASPFKVGQRVRFEAIDEVVFQAEQGRTP